MRSITQPLRDVQRDRPAGHCRRCGGERYRWDRGDLCPACAAPRQTEDKERNMTLLELSKEYRAGALAIKGRILELKAREPASREEQDGLDERVRVLSALWREARDLAVLTERYYERGYRRNVKYTL